MSLEDSCKRKMDGYASDDDRAGSSSSVRLRTDVNPSVGGVCCAESMNSKSSLQFLVRLFSGMQTLVIRADVDDTVGLVHYLIKVKAKIPMDQQLLIYKSKQLYPEQTLGQCCIENDAVLQLVGIMRSTQHVKAQRLADEIVSLISTLCKGKSGNEAWDDEVRAAIKGKLLEYLTILPHNDIGTAISHLQLFSCSGAPAALAMLYMSADNKMFGDQLIRQLFIFISPMPRFMYQQCVPILLEICKSLRSMPCYDSDDLFNMCRSLIGNMVGFVKIGTVWDGGRSNNLVALKDMRTFVEEAAYKIGVNMHAGVEPDPRTGPLLPLMSEVLYFKKFMGPIKKFLTEEFIRYRQIKAFGKRIDISSFREEYNSLSDTFVRLLAKMGARLKEMEALMPTKSESLGCYEYVLILFELNNVFKLFPHIEREFWTTLRNRKLSFCYLLIKNARRGDYYGWISEHKEVTNFECRRHLAMMLLPEVRHEYDVDLILEMLIERSQLLEQSFEYIAHAEPNKLRAGLFLEFKDEEATGPGVLREWFVLVCRAIFNTENALFVACPNDLRRFFPNPASKIDPLHLEYFKFAGRVIALALMYNVQVGILVDRVLFQQLAGRNISLEDIRDANPFLYSSCKKILQMDPEEVDQDILTLRYFVETDHLGTGNGVELCPDGENTVVDSKNRDNYVARLIHYYFVDSVKYQVAQFAQGFDDIINSDRLRKSFFQYLTLEDFDGLLYGSEKAINVEDWKAHTDYDGYKESDPQLSWFWETVGNMSAEQRKVLLFFWTSLKYLPVDGFGGLTSRLVIYKVDQTCDRLPSSQTCLYRLLFPPYESLKVMQDRLSIITQEHVGCSFGAS